MTQADRNRKIIVLGLPWESTENTIESHFSRYGEIEAAEVIHDRVTGKSRGFGFVTFQDSLAAEHALAEAHTIKGRRCDVKPAVPKGEPIPPKTRRIFIARIPLTVTEERFREYFESFGTVEDAYMPKDHTRQSYRGIGFVTFAEAGSTERVMAVKHRFDDHEVVVDRATPKDSAGSSPCTSGRYSLGCISSHPPQDANGALISMRSTCNRPGMGIIGGGFGSSGLTGLPHNQMELLQSFRMQQFQDIGVAQSQSEGVIDVEEAPVTMEVPSPTRVVLPPGLNPDMSQLGLHSQEVGLSPLTSTMACPLSRGLAVDGGNPLRDSTTRGIETATSPMANGTLTNSLLSHSSVELGPNSLIGLQPVLGGDAASPGHKMDSCHVSTARGGPRLFVGKLSKDTTEHDLRDYFMKYGYVMDVYMPRSKDNKKEHRGFGFVTFETEAAIQRVVAHGAHKLKGAVIAIDVAVPEEASASNVGLDSRRSNGLSDKRLTSVVAGSSIPLEADCGGGPPQASMHCRHSFQPY